MEIPENLDISDVFSVSSKSHYKVDSRGKETSVADIRAFLDYLSSKGKVLPSVPSVVRISLDDIFAIFCQFILSFVSIYNQIMFQFL